jgi:NAD-dependent deacetylase
MAEPLAFDPALLDALRSARHVVVLTGAGISAESGVPTFRDAQTGLWASFRAEDLATPGAFRRNPRMVWEWYAMRREALATVEPNAGHRALVTLEQRVARLTLVTQNVDGLHARAGSRAVIELHGNIARVRCSGDGRVADSWASDTRVPPHCAHCDRLLRPDVVWFGEQLPPEALSAAQRAAAGCDVFLSVGTSTEVYPAAELPFRALEAGACVVEVNPDVTPLSARATWALRGPAAVVLPRLVAATWP